jgi:hypothetical protein
MYPSTTLFIAIGQLAIVILVMFSYPLQVHPCRNCLDKVFSTNEKITSGTMEENVDEHGHTSNDMSQTKHVLMTSAILTAGFIVAYYVNDLQMGQPNP